MFGMVGAPVHVLHHGGGPLGYPALWAWVVGPPKLQGKVLETLEDVWHCRGPHQVHVLHHGGGPLGHLALWAWAVGLPNLKIWSWEGQLSLAWWWSLRSH